MINRYASWVNGPGKYQYVIRCYPFMIGCLIGFAAAIILLAARSLYDRL